MRQHSASGCVQCDTFLTKFFPKDSYLKLKKPVVTELREALEELFDALGTESLLLENEVEISSDSFIKDFIKMSDEVKSEKDIVEIWHLNPIVASDVFMVFEEVLFGGSDACEIYPDEYDDNFVEDETSGSAKVTEINKPGSSLA